MRAPLLAVVTLLALPGTTPAAEQTVVEQPAKTAVKSHAGIALFSLWQDGAYRLAVSRAAAPPEVLPFPAQSVPFEADIGPGPDGSPTVVVGACQKGAGCGIDLLRLGDDRPVRIGTFPRLARAPLRPSLYRSRLAWVQATGRGQDERHSVRMRRLSDPRSAPSRLLPGAPRNGTVAELELRDHRIALSTIAENARAGICGTRQIRLVDARRKRVRVLASQICGLNGQTWVGPSFHGRWVYWARFCYGEPRACGRGTYGALRYRIRDGRYELSRFGRILTGWATDGPGAAYEVRGEVCGSIDGPGACDVVHVTGLTFRRTKPLR